MPDQPNHSSCLQSPVITGLGMATPLGLSAPQTWHALLKGDFIRDHSLVPTAAPEDGSRILRIALCAAREAIADADWPADVVADAGTALVVGTSKGPISDWLAASPIAVAPYVVGGLDPAGIGRLAAELAECLGAPAVNRLTVSAACATGLLAFIRAMLMLRSGEAHRVLVVAAESSVHPLFLASFARLGVLASAGTACRPFDRYRTGFLMSEAAAAVCLEARSSGGSGNVGVPVDGYGIASDAEHIIRPDAEGRSLRFLLAEAMAEQPIDLIHAHGTGTPANDEIELAAIEATVARADPLPILYSHKGALGHSLGAAGLVAVALNCLAHRHSVVPPSVQTTSPLPTERVQICRSVVHRQIRRSLAIASGFGGTVAAVILGDRTIQGPHTRFPR